ncbi:MAG: biotin transporter BioY [Chloroflexi bacterium]|nr:biotin transporter BioY [Chloroflexota bacterium]HEV8053856.1 biotin transporter BioY [Candidatus Limnocylindrales bacterium]
MFATRLERLDRLPNFEHGVTLGDFFVPIRVGERASAWQRHLVLVVMGSLLIIAGAYVSFPVPQIQLPGIYLPANPYVPFSLQTFAVLFTGATLGFRRGVAATILYLLMGAVGLPVFAVDASGAHAAGMDTIVSVAQGRVVLGATGGYLVGFVFAGAIAGTLAEHGWDRTLRGSLAAMFIANVAIYVVGVPWLAVAAHLTIPQTLQAGLYPFIPGDLLKLAIAAGLLPVGWWFVRRRAHDL